MQNRHTKHAIISFIKNVQESHTGSAIYLVKHALHQRSLCVKMKYLNASVTHDAAYMNSAGALPILKDKFIFSKTFLSQ